MDIKEIEKLKNSLIPDINKFLESIVKELLNSKVKNDTLSPLLLTHKEFVDLSLSRIIKKIKEKIFLLAKQKGMPVGDKIFEVKLEYLSAYIFKYDMKHDNVIYNRIAKYIINLIKKDPQSLNQFVSTLRRDVYAGKYGKFRYPELYPFDKNRYSSPIPELKKILTHVDSIKKQLKHKESELNKVTKELDAAKETLSQLEFAIEDTKEIVVNLKKKYKEVELNNRMSMVKNQYKYFGLLTENLKKKIEKYEKEKNFLMKSINGFKEKNKELLNKEEEIINTISSNLKKHKVKL
ncbi:hypothetical protein [Hydrogenimonas thermophila]|uniref:Uncharacterized protein n=1 Tax=Hydrogenimonas thermophila TaxID=223786 RepID=A0A1I5KVJ5_9BACT|nr:hypothetical protein [Hydrogenimonas thermophila]SFO88461.1 hypothetical protein SAMN05216234_10189 [Hydrogenimonas thermophila]